MESFDLYEDIARRTGGDIYVGVVGPVRTGKSTFIAKFMETLVLPNVEDGFKKQRIIDEMPQAADGRTIMTTQPKFVPDEGAKITLGDNLNLNVRLIDCVGYLVGGAVGHREGERARMVRTPWEEDEMPFERAAEIGTQKVVSDHSTIGLVMTTDGTIAGIKREDYVEAEERVVAELKSLGKPFSVILNTKRPENRETKALASALEKKYNVSVLAKNVLELSEEDISEIMASVLMEFPIKSVEIGIPKWLQCLPRENALICDILGAITSKVTEMVKMSDHKVLETLFTDHPDIEKVTDISTDFGKGVVTVNLTPKPHVFYKVLSETCGVQIDDDFKLMNFIKGSNVAVKEYGKLKNALADVERVGYGVVQPLDEDISIDEPEIMKSGGRYGVRLKANATSLHIMKVDVSTEVSPIVGTEAQSEEMFKYLMTELESNKNGIWDTNLFGKSLDTLVKDGINGKIHNVPEDAQNKIRRTLGRIVNEGRGGVLCVLI